MNKINKHYFAWLRQVTPIVYDNAKSIYEVLSEIITLLPEIKANQDDFSTEMDTFYQKLQDEKKKLYKRLDEYTELFLANIRTYKETYGNKKTEITDSIAHLIEEYNSKFDTKKETLKQTYDNLTEEIQTQIEEILTNYATTYQNKINDFESFYINVRANLQSFIDNIIQEVADYINDQKNIYIGDFLDKIDYNYFDEMYYRVSDRISNLYSSFIGEIPSNFDELIASQVEVFTKAFKSNKNNVIMNNATNLAENMYMSNSYERITENDVTYFKVDTSESYYPNKLIVEPLTPNIYLNGDISKNEDEQTKDLLMYGHTDNFSIEKIIDFNVERAYIFVGEEIFMSYYLGYVNGYQVEYYASYMHSIEYPEKYDIYHYLMFTSRNKCIRTNYFTELNVDAIPNKEVSIQGQLVDYDKENDTYYVYLVNGENGNGIYTINAVAESKPTLYTKPAENEVLCLAYIIGRRVSSSSTTKTNLAYITRNDNNSNLYFNRVGGYTTHADMNIKCTDVYLTKLKGDGYGSMDVIIKIINNNNLSYKLIYTNDNYNVYKNLDLTGEAWHSPCYYDYMPCDNTGRNDTGWYGNNLLDIVTVDNAYFLVYGATDRYLNFRFYNLNLPKPILLPYNYLSSYDENYQNVYVSYLDESRINKESKLNTQLRYFCQTLNENIYNKRMVVDYATDEVFLCDNRNTTIDEAGKIKPPEMYEFKIKNHAEPLINYLNTDIDTKLKLREQYIPTNNYVKWDKENKCFLLTTPHGDETTYQIFELINNIPNTEFIPLLNTDINNTFIWNFKNNYVYLFDFSNYPLPANCKYYLYFGNTGITSDNLVNDKRYLSAEFSEYTGFNFGLTVLNSSGEKLTNVKCNFDMKLCETMLEALPYYMLDTKLDNFKMTYDDVLDEYTFNATNTNTDNEIAIVNTDKIPNGYLKPYSTYKLTFKSVSAPPNDENITVNGTTSLLPAIDTTIELTFDYIDNLNISFSGNENPAFVNYQFQIVNIEYIGIMSYDDFVANLQPMTDMEYDNNGITWTNTRKRVVRGNENASPFVLPVDFSLIKPKAKYVLISNGMGNSFSLNETKYDLNGWTEGALVPIEKPIFNTIINTYYSQHYYNQDDKVIFRVIDNNILETLWQQALTNYIPDDSITEITDYDLIKGIKFRFRTNKPLLIELPNSDNLDIKKFRVYSVCDRNYIDVVNNKTKYLSKYIKLKTSTYLYYNDFEYEKGYPIQIKANNNFDTTSRFNIVFEVLE